MKFGYEDLEVWKRAVDFACRVIDVLQALETSTKHFRIIEQGEAAVISIAMNLAEGKGRFSKKEFIQFCFIARGSLYETMTLLEIFLRKKWIPAEDFLSLKNEAYEIAAMIKGLINSLKKSQN
jgi:four helix bundle protein